uniref:Zn(2)-C6 fungal-type domain-containing protein n=1 Tax=Spongospora subterranea TaxID=70186 RepID=A0A0H5R6Z5_9EUKA|eukprot:CRZ09883.1 hypothetical protein [Spongospora subterranea]
MSTSKSMPCFPQFSTFPNLTVIAGFRCSKKHNRLVVIIHISNNNDGLWRGRSPGMSVAIYTPVCHIHISPTLRGRTGLYPLVSGTRYTARVPLLWPAFPDSAVPLRVFKYSCAVMSPDCNSGAGLSLMADLAVSGSRSHRRIPPPALIRAPNPDQPDASAAEPQLDSGTGDTETGRRVTIACNECVRAKMRCSNERPCERCVRRCCEHLCVDRPSRISIIAPTPAVVIQAAAVRSKRGASVISRKQCGPCIGASLLCDTGRPCQRCVKRGDLDSCVDPPHDREQSGNGSETDSDEFEMLEEIVGGRITKFAAVSEVASLPPPKSIPKHKGGLFTFPTYANRSSRPRSASAGEPISSNTTVGGAGVAGGSGGSTGVLARISPTKNKSAQQRPQNQSFMPFTEKQSSGNGSRNRLMRGKPPFMVRSPLQFPIKLTGHCRFAYRDFSPDALSSLLLSPARFQHFMSMSLDVLTSEECLAMRLEMIVAAVKDAGPLAGELLALCSKPALLKPFKTRCITLLLDAATSHEPCLTIDDDDILRIAFWESPCAVIRLAMDYSWGDYTEVSLSMNTEAQRLLGYPSHSELDQLQQDFAKAKTNPHSIPFFWRLFSQRSLLVLGMAQIERDFRALTQLRVDLELVANNGQHIPARTYWKYRLRPDGLVGDIMIAVKRIV